MTVVQVICSAWPTASRQDSECVSDKDNSSQALSTPCSEARRNAVCPETAWSWLEAFIKFSQSSATSRATWTAVWTKAIIDDASPIAAINNREYRVFRLYAAGQ